MKPPAIKIILIISLIILLTLIVIYQLITKTLKSQKSSSNLSPTIPSSSPSYRPFTPQNSTPYKNLPPPGQNYNQINLSQLNPMGKNQLEKLFQLQKKIPLETNNFYVTYSYLLEKFIIQEKNDKGKENFFNYLKENGYSDLIKEDIFIFTQKSVIDYEKEQEEILYKNRENSLKEISNFTLPQIISPKVNSSPSQKFSDEIKSLLELLKILFNTSPLSSQPADFLAPSPTFSLPTSIPPTTTAFFPRPPSSLDEIFTEVSQKVGVPKKILEAIVTIELPSTFRLSPEEISRYSTPGNYWPNCGPNSCSATGPTQMTIGIDNKNSSTCSSCCWQGRCLTSCPNQWRVYGNAVNLFAQENHQPLPCNIRDNIFASAAKLKNDSGASDPINWTQEQVFKAGKRYYGNCTVSYQRLGNRTYCQFLWDYYQNRL